MNEQLIVCSCGRHFEVYLGPEEEEKTCSQCGSVIRIPAAPPLGPSRPAPPAPSLADAVAQSEVSLFFDDSPEPEPRVTASSAGPQSPAISSRTSTPVAPVTQHQETCIRCGKAFRGDWDRVDTDAGHFCHICANQAHGVPAKRPAPSPVPPSWESDVRKAGSWVALNEQTQEGHLQAEVADGDRRRFEMKVFAVFVVVTFVAMYFLVPSDGGEHSDVALSVPRKLPTPVVLAIYVLDALLKLGSYSVALFLTFRETGYLPRNARVLPYVPQIVGLGLAIWAVLAGAGLASTFLLSLPGGAFVAGFVTLAGFAGAIWLLYCLCNLDITDCLYFAVYLGLCSLLAWAIRALISGVAASVFL